MECNNKAPLLRLSGVISESIVDGPGFRYVVFTQGCPHGCPGCHNPQTHDFNGGTLIDPLTLLPEIDENPLLAGVTFSGGEPFCQPEALLPLAREIKNSTSTSAAAKPFQNSFFIQIASFSQTFFYPMFF